MKPKEFIENLYKIRTSFGHESHARTISKLLDIVSVDIYSESQRFLYELLQNADDSCSLDMNNFYIDFRENALIVSHDGDPFSDVDIESITDAGASTKISKKSTTGYKGIGFKSVFAKSNRVSIFSGGYQFRFDKVVVNEGYPWQTIPIWTEISDLPNDIQQLMPSLNHPVTTIIEIEKADELKVSLQELLSDGQILLFLRRVSQIVISYNGNVVNIFNKSTANVGTLSKKVELIKNGKILSTWLVRVFSDVPVPQEVSSVLSNDNKVPEKLRSAKYSEITFAAILNEDIIEIPTKDQRLIYTFLPTKVKEYDLPFLVNGNFLTNAPRESIHQDNAWNIWLFEVIARLNFTWLEELALTPFQFQVLKLLPNKFPVSSNELKNSFNKGFNLASKTCKFITAFNGDLLRPNEALYDKTALSEQTFITKQVLLEYLKDIGGVTLKENCFIHQDMQLKSKLIQIDVREFNLDNITSFFKSKPFVNNHRLNDNFELIKFLKQKSDKDHTGVLFDELRDLPFVFDQEHILRNPEDGICFPAGDGIQNFEMGTVPVIAGEVYQEIQQNNSIHEWFLKLGTQTPSETAYINNIILPQLGSENFITVDNYLKFTAYLVKMFQKGILDTNILARLRAFKLKTDDDISFEQAQKCYLPKVYNPNVNLETIVPLTFVSTQYLQLGFSAHDMYIFFKAISVKDSIEIETIISNCNISSIEEITDTEWVNKTRATGKTLAEQRGGYGFALSNLIYSVKIPSFLHFTTKNYDYSKIFWKKMLDNSSIARELALDAAFYYGTGNGKNSYQVPVKNYFGYFVLNNACIPTSLGTLEKSENVYTSIKEIHDIAGDYYPVLEYDDNITADWSNYFNFKQKLEIEDYLNILKIISDKGSNPNKKDIKNIARIYSKLSSLLPNLANDEKDKIHKWGHTARLLSTNGIFESTSELKRITKEGFSNVQGLKMIFIPSTNEKDDLNQLLNLCGVLTISEFIPQYEGLKNEESLKVRFENILPYLALVAQKKSMEESDEFERLYALLDQISFSTANTIFLSFKNGDENITGPTIKVFREPNKICFQGRWNTERILLELIDELKNYLKFSGTNEELRFLLLENDFNEIEVWLKENGIDIIKAKGIRKFKKQESRIQPSQAELNKSTPLDLEEKNSFPVLNYTPKYSATSFDYSKIKVRESSSDADDPIIEMEAEIETYVELSDENLRKFHGRWAEDFVNGHLMQNFPKANIQWVNEEGESFLPYDFILNNGNVDIYIEVKGTPSLSKDLVYLSKGEWKFMISKGENYLFYRVYGTDSNAPELKISKNPAQQIKDGDLIPYKALLEI